MTLLLTAKDNNEEGNESRESFKLCQQTEVTVRLRAAGDRYTYIVQ